MSRTRWIVAVAKQHHAAKQIMSLGEAEAGQVVTLATVAQHELSEAWREMVPHGDHRERSRAFAIVSHAVLVWKDRAARDRAVARSEAVRLGVVAALARVPKWMAQ